MNNDYKDGYAAGLEIAELKHESELAIREEFACALVQSLQEDCDALRSDAADFYMAYRLKCDEKTKAQAVEIEKLRAECAALRARADKAEADYETLLENSSTEVKRLRAESCKLEDKNHALQAELAATTQNLQAAEKALNICCNQRDKAIAERIALRIDAERYRWLRGQHWDESPLAVVTKPKQAIKPGHDAPSLERLDTAIDAARALKEAK